MPNSESQPAPATYGGPIDERCTYCAGACRSHTVNAHVTSIARGSVERARRLIDDSLTRTADPVLVERLRYELASIDALLSAIQTANL